MTELLDLKTATIETVWFPVVMDPDAQYDELIAFDAPDDFSRVTVEKGVSRLKSVEIGVTGDGSMLTGTLKGKVTSYDYKALYKVYNLDESDSTMYGSFTTRTTGTVQN